jgi:hypothetical protein
MKDSWFPLRPNLCAATLLASLDSFCNETAEESFWRFPVSFDGIRKRLLLLLW